MNSLTNIELEGLYTPKETAEFLCVSPRTLANWRAARKNLDFVRVGGTEIGGIVRGCSVFYEGAEIRRYMEKNYGLVAKYA
ncbi:hypothetical protein [Caudovirus D_HF5_3]|jgi:hypothetical protein|uniref:Helix-turn-helix domain protein n=1 Tax=Myoviridae sp. ctw4b6 TaxID=2825206 RepID=A0A8S5QBZ2_9CAUD|nr:hypothetical protein [Caudovirus D_HF5_3]DAE16600.1 MAG TPA: helix-turn-helix domain protein [Myoviridae sp. ctw4b6]DAE76438.1 MAG TPA: helix-turn-helix domain protein [Caudoviricetes sp.]DAI36904.1 MAG TPA: helix-turn-helix domain protein [Caudoviricetes sp.]DAK64603.1 MAG TPA: helix-turn-helix domain protein [Caudoviricetes sp.]